ncbi:collagen-like repeat preface domain-containing protein [Bacillus cereus]|uniref:collagen-like repeat preface domain-containing protein n=1 Tax=Bacillus cereus TaxID=1396 RepID=UPI003013D1CE
MITLLNSLIAAIAAFFANPSDANRLALLNLFTQLLNLLNELAPSPEGNFLKQLIQSIINLLQSPNPNLGQLLSLLQQFYSALAPFFFSLILDPASLQLLLNLLAQLIGVTPHAHQLKNFHYPQVTKNVILSKKLARKGDIFYESFDSR